MVKLSEVVPPSGMLAAPNNLLMAGGATTVMEAVAVFPVPPSVDVTVTELFFTPAVVPVTLTVSVQEPLAASVPADKLTDPDPPVAVVVPLQVLVSPLDVATRMPAGSVSVNPTPVNPMPVFGFMMVKVSEVDPFTGMLDAPNILLMVGGEATVMLAEAVLPVPPLVEVTLPVRLFLTPLVAPVTVTLNWQLVLVAILPPVNVMVPGARVVSTPPPHAGCAPVVGTVSPAGRVSVTPTPVSPTLAFGFVMVKVSDVVPLTAMFAAPKDLAIDGGATTVRLAEAVVPVPPSVEVTLPVVLFLMPAVVPVTFTLKLQELLAVTLPADKLITPVPAVAVTVPAQLPVSPLGVETTKPEGNVSVKATPVSAVELLLFWIVKVSEVAPFNGMLGAPNNLLMAGGATTVTEAFEVFPVPPSVEVT
jgi:hypothetical protein